MPAVMVLQGKDLIMPDRFLVELSLQRIAEYDKVNKAKPRVCQFSRWILSMLYAGRKSEFQLITTDFSMAWIMSFKNILICIFFYFVESFTGSPQKSYIEWTVSLLPWIMKKDRHYNTMAQSTGSHIKLGNIVKTR